MDLFPPAIAILIAVALIAPVLMDLARRARDRSRRPGSGKSDAQLAREYARVELIGRYIYLGLVAVTGLLSFLALLGLNHLLLLLLEPSIFLLPVYGAAWGIPALVFAFYQGALLYQYVFVLALGETRFAELLEYMDRNQGVDTRGFLRSTGRLLVPLALLYTVLVLDTYVRVDDEGIYINGVLGLGETGYRFDEVIDIELSRKARAANGRLTGDPHFILWFADGSRFNFRESPTIRDFDLQQDVAQFIAAASGREITISDVSAAY